MKDIIVFDLDGTLANTDECRHLLEGAEKRWDEFYLAATKVSAIPAVVKTFFAFHNEALYDIYIASGRSDLVRAETFQWLMDNRIYCDKLLMRKHGDFTPDDELKKSWVESGEIPLDRILCVFEDRNRMVKMWRSLGLVCFHVADGDF